VTCSSVPLHVYGESVTITIEVNILRGGGDLPIVMHSELAFVYSPYCYVNSSDPLLCSI
jgi:hypothetical protein